MNATPDFQMPEYAIGIKELPDGNEVMMLEISTATARFECVLAYQDTYSTTADKLSEGIRRAGATMKRKSIITPVKELPDGLRKKRR